MTCEQNNHTIIYNRELTAEEFAEIHNTLMEDVEQ